MKIDHPTPGQIPGLRALWQEAFGDSNAYLDLFFAHAFAPSRCLCIEETGKIAAAAYWFDCEIPCGKTAYIYAVATANSHRHRGLCHTLMEQIHCLLARQGYCGSLLVPEDETLRRLYTEMGYHAFGGIREFSCAAGPSPLSLRAIGAEEYARLRRAYLPRNSVLQERENLEFLASFANFYAGEDFLLAASREGALLWGMELLGNADAAPGILKSLGAGRGVFRTPGPNPFAMYRPLTQTPAPGYFAFAFDEPVA